MGDFIKDTDLNISVNIKQFLSRSPTDGEVDRTVLNKAIATAEGIVKAYLGSKYSLPLDDDSETALVKSITENITIYNLYLKTDGLAMPEKWLDAYAEAKDMLKAIQTGNLGLGLDEADEPEAKKSTAFTTYMRG